MEWWDKLQTIVRKANAVLPPGQQASHRRAYQHLALKAPSAVHWAAGGHQQVIDIGLLAAERVRANMTACAVLVVHHHGLVPFFCQALAVQACVGPLVRATVDHRAGAAGQIGLVERRAAVDCAIDDKAAPPWAVGHTA